ncbi:hypothetical protein BLNAU_25181 [Blattamonas nauphoetae]|uniref:Uncharacterized protein n=1 Tax=Blattamonas nauphoetae TaxID=2049346 RepID=A0ABQ9WKA7_9EUKA|nr:hypothetical protein BLNAU_25181 [Blattamonas nauphoetae]
MAGEDSGEELKILMSRKANEVFQRVRQNSEAMTTRTSTTAQASLPETGTEETKRETNQYTSGSIELGFVEDEKLIRHIQTNPPSVEPQSDIRTTIFMSTHVFHMKRLKLEKALRCH